MNRTTKQINLEEISGDQLPDQMTAQRNAITPIARALVESMRGLLADGLLVIHDGKIIPNIEGKNL